MNKTETVDFFSARVIPYSPENSSAEKETLLAEIARGNSASFWRELLENNPEEIPALFKYLGPLPREIAAEKKTSRKVTRKEKEPRLFRVVVSLRSRDYAGEVVKTVSILDSFPSILEIFNTPENVRVEIQVGNGKTWEDYSSMIRTTWLRIQKQKIWNVTHRYASCWDIEIVGNAAEKPIGYSYTRKSDQKIVERIGWKIQVTASKKTALKQFINPRAIKNNRRWMKNCVTDTCKFSPIIPGKEKEQQVFDAMMGKSPVIPTVLDVLRGETEKIARGYAPVFDANHPGY